MDILFKITKNRITKLAVKETPCKDLEKFFTGPTAAAISSILLCQLEFYQNLQKIMIN